MINPHWYRRALVPVCLAAAAAVLAGCGSSGDDATGKGGPAPASPGAVPATALTPMAPGAEPPSPETFATPAAGPATAAAVPSPTSAAAAPGDLGACYSGSCTITVTHPVTVPLDGHRFGVSSFRVTEVGADSVTVATDSGGNHLQSTGSAGSYLTLNNLTAHVLSAAGGSARLAVSVTDR